MTKRKNDKLCRRCNTIKLFCEFGENITATNSKRMWCKDCADTYYNQWKILNKDTTKPIETDYYSACYSILHSRAVLMHKNMRRRSKLHNVPFDLSVEWIEAKLMTGVCDVTGIPFVIREKEGKEHNTNSFSPSIDRISQKGPYTQSNCQMTCWIYNRAKGAFPLDDLYEMIAKLINVKNQTLINLNPPNLSLTNPIES